MTAVRVVVAAGLREHAGGESTLDLEVPDPTTAGAVLDALAASPTRRSAEGSATRPARCGVT